MDQATDVVRVDVPMLTVDEADWPPGPPYVLDRNLTIRGSDALLELPVLRIKAREKVIAAPRRVDLRMQRLALVDFRGVRDPLLTPGLDLLVPPARDAPPPERDKTLWPIWHAEDSVLILDACMPASLIKAYAESDSLEPSPRYPSTQTYTLGISQPTCAPPGPARRIASRALRSTAAGGAAASAPPPPSHATAPAGLRLMGRCWPDAHFVEDFSTVGMMPIEDGDGIKRRTNRMIVRWVNTTVVCRRMLDDACLRALSPYGCLILTLINGTDGLPPLPGELGAAPGALVDAAGALQPQPGQQPANTVVAVSAGASGGGGEGDGGPSAGLLAGCIVGGTLGVLLAIAAAALLVRRRRRHQRAQEQKLSAKEAGPHDFTPLDGSPSLQICVRAAAGANDAAACDPSGSPAQPESSSAFPRHSEAINAMLGTDYSGTTLSANPGSSTNNAPSAAPSWRTAGSCSRYTPAAEVVTGRTPFRADMRCNGELQVHEPGQSRAPDAGSGPAASAAPTPPAAPGGEDNVVKLLPDVLGRGGFGRVRKGVYQGSLVAVKQLLGEHDAGTPGYERVIATFSQELEVLARCEHPCIVRLLAACVKPPAPFVVLELLDTSLDKVMYGKGGAAVTLPMHLVLHIGFEVAKGLEYLHPTIMHRDLKPANVLISDPWGPKPVVKITDFGLARLRETVVQTETPEAGTPAYIAPECFDVNYTCVSHKADVYALGVLLWEMLAGMQPWAGLPVVQVAYQVTMRNRRLPLPPADAPLCRWPFRLISIIEQCWDGDPARRPAAAEVVKWLALEQERQAQHAQQAHASLHMERHLVLQQAQQAYEQAGGCNGLEDEEQQVESGATEQPEAGHLASELMDKTPKIAH
ncbi:hypothetical protein HYH03_005111 [Edaphochlamys debaryana]|uniref:Protein kinase domain-containing protein n=1 Tax=Edaphochlamys debaryana TaxID=47281 RepID=A0A835Y5U3_9CHLO|nr:hypothetical protein HYH03_005111 [Edaphochlamys debaryana]|eukprot:KAG2496695.1 hypothetical protein HYH03_005111 [Edaphochlamys debaryana]